MAELTLHNLILCDDVRVEDNSKHILIGVYTNGVMLKQMPGTLAVTLWLIVSISEAGKHTIQIELRGKKGEIGTITVDADVNDANGLIPITCPKLPVKFEEPDEIEVYLSLDSGEADLKGRFPIRLNPDLRSSAPSPPSEQSESGASE